MDDLSRWIQIAETEKPRTTDSGAYFRVAIYDEFVVKTPKKEKEQVNCIETLDFIAQSQTYLSERMETVFPCYRVGMSLYTAIPPGVRADVKKDKWKHIKELCNKEVKEIKKHGYIVTDLGKKNVYYDEKRDKVYVIDYHKIRKNKEA